MEGKGMFFDKEGKLIYDGEVKDGKLNGKGKLFTKEGKLAYEGDFVDGEKMDLELYISKIVDII
jgi:hypothetical protein